MKMNNYTKLTMPAFMFAPSKTVSGANLLRPGQTIALQMHQFSFQLAWSRRF